MKGMKGKKKIMKINIESDEEQKDVFEQSMQVNKDGINFIKEKINIDKQGGIKIDDNVQLRLIAQEDLQEGDLLGRGVSGTVTKGVYKKTGEPVAIKSINIYDKEKRNQLKNDLISLQTENHCHFLIRLIGAHFEEGQIKVILELMDFGSLRDLIKHARKLKVKKDGKQSPLIDEQIVSYIVQQILQGLIYLHCIKKQLHRDIKPENILINSKGEIKLTDFGISRNLENTDFLCNTFVGTINYMSLERLEVKKYDHLSDIWSLGLIVIELITGKFYYKQRQSYLELIQNIKERKQPHIDEELFEISDDLKDFLEKCCQIKKENRSSAIELAAHPWILNNMFTRQQCSDDLLIKLLKQTEVEQKQEIVPIQSNISATMMSSNHSENLKHLTKKLIGYNQPQPIIIQNFN